MTDEFCALCAELIEAVLSDNSHIDCMQIARRARTLLAESEVAWEPMPLPGDAEGLAEVFWAEPEAVGPSELELEAIELALWDKHRTKGGGGEEFMYDNDFSYALKEYRAALAKWGRPTPQPVPLSERLPGPEDCNAEGMCWWLIEPYPRPVGPGGKFWSLSRYYPGAAHWLPAHALPTPEATND